MGKPSILFVSYGHEVTNLASTIQNHRLIEAMEKYYDVTILARSKNRRADSSFFIWSPNLFIIDRVLYKVFPFLLSVFCIDRLLWAWKAFYKIRNSIYKYDFIIIPYEPYTIRSLQKRIKKNYKARIITLLYDPYYDNIFFSQSKFGKQLRLNIEESIVKMSNCVIVNNSRMYNTLIERYKDVNIHILPLCGKEIVEQSPGAKNDKFTLVHAGNIGNKRNINSLNKTITILKKKIKNLSEKFNVLLYGTYCQGYEKVMAEHNDDVIIFKGRVSWEEIAVVLARADALLLIDPMDGSNYSYPSKLCEYFQYRKLIIGFSGKDTPSYTALQESNNIVYSEKEEELMADELRILLTDGVRPSTPEEYTRQFYPSNVARSLYDIMISVK